MAKEPQSRLQGTAWEIDLWEMQALDPHLLESCILDDLLFSQER